MKRSSSILGFSLAVGLMAGCATVPEIVEGHLQIDGVKIVPYKSAYLSMAACQKDGKAVFEQYGRALHTELTNKRSAEVTRNYPGLETYNVASVTAVWACVSNKNNERSWDHSVTGAKFGTSSYSIGVPPQFKQ